MDNQHKLIKGYRDLSQSEIDSINSIKLAEQDIGQLWQQVSKVETVDPRQMAIAKTKLQEAFMWFIRGVAQPLDVFTLEIPGETFIDRLRLEVERVSSDLAKLSVFIDGEASASVSEESLEDMKTQRDLMTQLVRVLSKRYKDVTA